MSKSWILRALPTNFWERLDVLPPFMVRLLAKKGNDIPLPEQAMTDAEIAVAAGLTAAEVRLISFRTDWRGIELTHARAFLKACRCDPANRKDMIRIREYLSCSPKWKHLKYSPDFRTTFEPLINLYARK